MELINNLSGTVKLPLIALRGIVVTPNMNLHFEVGRKLSTLALDRALATDQLVFLITQRFIDIEVPAMEDLYTVGTVCRIKQVFKHSDESSMVMVSGLKRATIGEMDMDDGFPSATVTVFEEDYDATDPELKKAMMREIQEAFSEYSSVATTISPEILMHVLSADEPADLADYLASNLPLSYDDRQAILDVFDHVERVKETVRLLLEEREIIEIEKDLHRQVQESMDQNQRDYYLREKIKIIQEELGDSEPFSEADSYILRIRQLGLSNELEDPLIKEANRLSRLPYGSSETGVVRNYLDTILDLPWNTRTKDRLDLAKVEKKLNADHYGLDKVKKRIIEYLAVRQLTPDAPSSQILCLVGPPGVGKTSIGSSIAAAMGKKFVRMSLGGIRDEAEIRGHRKTYIGAMPGRIINALKTAGTKNPLILLDEVDKLSQDYRGDPASALLEVLDGEQNFAFRDHYIELPFDLSEVLFITTANSTDTIPRPLLDRMEIIRLTSYTDEEKLHITRDYLLSKQIAKHGLKKRDIRISDDAIRAVIDRYTRESGVRNVEREIANICRKCAVMRVNGDRSILKIEPDTLEGLIGPAKFKREDRQENDEIGVVNGLAWTSVGGETLKVEVVSLPGTGKLELTGSLGDVMKESAKASISYIRSRADLLGIDGDFHKTRDLHIHVPEGATPKDGPSAGITIATALASELTGVPVRHDVAMTGEITLRGNVLPIGGLTEKTMAALRAGIKNVVIPEKNMPDLDEIDKNVRDALNFHPVSTIDEVLDFAMVKPEKPAGKKKGARRPSGHDKPDSTAEVRQ